MVTMTKTAATNASFRARPTTGVTLGHWGTSLSAVRGDVRMDRSGGVSAGCDVSLGAIRVETAGLPFVVTPQGSRAWSPPS